MSHVSLLAHMLQRTAHQKAASISTITTHSNSTNIQQQQGLVLNNAPPAVLPPPGLLQLQRPV
jgi:hypothetical protein